MKNNIHALNLVIVMLVLFVIACNSGGGKDSERGDRDREKTRTTNQATDAQPESSPRSRSTKNDTIANNIVTDNTASRRDEEESAPSNIPGGKVFTWNGHGVSVTLPAGWKQRTTSGGEVSFKGPDTDSPSVSIDELVTTSGTLSPSIVTNDYDFQQKQMQDGKREEVKYLTIDGVRGSYSRDAKASSDYGSRIIRWKGYRTFQGRPQVINILVSTTERNYAQNRAVMEQVLNNVRFTD